MSDYDMQTMRQLQNDNRLLSAAEAEVRTLRAQLASRDATIEALRDGLNAQLESWESDAKASIAEASRIRSAVKANTDAEDRCVLRANLWRDCASKVHNIMEAARTRTDELRTFEHFNSGDTMTDAEQHEMPQSVMRPDASGTLGGKAE